MPLYVYTDNATGMVVERIMPVESRDAWPGHSRITVPQRIGIMTGIMHPAVPDRAVPTALKQMEDKIPAREIARQAGFSVEHLKKVWQT